MDRTKEMRTPPKKPYERPRIVWREPYEPISFGASCGKKPGDLSCVPIKL